MREKKGAGVALGGGGAFLALPYILCHDRRGSLEVSREERKKKEKRSSLNTTQLIIIKLYIYQIEGKKERIRNSSDPLKGEKKIRHSSLLPSYPWLKEKNIVDRSILCWGKVKALRKKSTSCSGKKEKRGSPR